MLLLASISTLLVGCGESNSGRVQGELPTVPADIQSCFREGVGNVPEKALTVAEVETLWKHDRVRAVVMQKCGQRFLAWYGSLRANWK